MSVEIIPASYADLVFIARRMRALDAEEIWPVVWLKKPEDFALGIASSGGMKFIALSGGVPVAAWGAVENRPAFWSVWMFATDRWQEVAMPVTRQIRRDMMPALIATGASRADCWSMDGHDVAHRWLEVLGARREASLEDYGPLRKTYHCYSWTRSRLEKEGKF